MSNNKKVVSVCIEGKELRDWSLTIRGLNFMSVRSLKMPNGMPVRTSQAAQQVAEEVLDRDYPGWRNLEQL